MANIKVKIVLPLVIGNKSYGQGEEISLDQEVAYTYAKKGVVEFNSEKAFKDLDKKITEAIAKKIQEDEDKAKELEALLYRDDLEKEKVNLEKRISDINAILGIKGK